MTEHVGFLAQLPVRAVLDGELVSLDDEGKPDFPQLCECVLQRHPSIPLMCMGEHELEGVVAKRRSGRYIPGGRGWIKTKNRDYWRHEMEREGAPRSRRRRAFV
jgi:ATP-dependent DNA ligase